MQSCGRQRKEKSEEGTKPRSQDRQAAGRDGDLRASRPPRQGLAKNRAGNLDSQAAGRDGDLRANRLPRASQVENRGVEPQDILRRMASKWRNPLLNPASSNEPRRTR